MNLILVVLYIFTIIYAFLPIKIHNKKNREYFWIWCAILFCVLTITSNSYADLYNYENYYDDVNIKKWPISYRAMPIGWGLLCKFFGVFNMTYRGMFTCIIFFSMFLIHRFIRKLNCNEKVFWGLFIIFPGLIQIVQLRFFLGSSIAIFAFGFLLRENTEKKKQRKNVILFIFGIILSFFIHNSCLFLAVLIFAMFFKRLNIPKILAVSLLGIFILIVLMPFVPKFLLMFIHPFYVERYFTASTSRTTTIRFIKIILIWILNVSLAYFSVFSDIKIKKNDSSIAFNSRLVVSRCFSGICLLAFSIPLLYFDENFHRYFEIGFMFLYIIFAKLPISENSKKKTSRHILLFFILIALLYCIYVYYPFESIVKPLFRYEGLHPIFR